MSKFGVSFKKIKAEINIAITVLGKFYELQRFLQ